jgi:ribosomal protein S18 acetylase RimI-like enzyme
MEECWQIKEKIRKEQNFLRQAKAFYTDTYIRSDVYTATNDEESILGFAVTTGDEYLALLGVRPKYQGNEIGTKIIDYLKSEHETIYCHTRESNEDAVRFYESNGFIIEDLEPNYYNNNENAFVLRYERGYSS